jgi:hypothetical protein
MKRFFTAGDRVLIVGIVLATIGSFFAVHRKPGTTVEIHSSAGMIRYPLDSDQTIRVAGPLGESVVRIEKGKVRMESSPCPEQICQSMGSISRIGSSIACLPNRIFIRIDGQTRPEWDAITE